MFWPIMGTIVTGIVGALTNASLDWPTTASRGALSAGIGFSTSSLLLPLTRVAVTLVFVLIPYVWWQRRTKENVLLGQAQ
jgi:hypothetical protein